MNSKYKNLLIDKASDLVTALKKMDEGAEKILFVVEDEDKLYGTLSDGDIRRWILRTGELTGVVSNFCTLSPIYVEANYEIASVRTTMRQKKIEAIPVLDKEKRILDVMLFENVFDGKKSKFANKGLDIPVVIMAGGKGTRLDPFTRILPKPLIPVGNKAIIEYIIDKFREYRISDFYLSLNHKSKMIQYYFDELKPAYNVTYIIEDKPLGTAGSLKYLQDKIDGSFFLTNCDIIVEGNYADILEHHLSRNNDLTIVASMRHYEIPYGICEIENGGDLKEITEKPEYDLLANTGLYLLKSETLNYVPENTFYHITDLIEALKQDGRRVGVYPISEQSWIDIGQWTEYKNNVKVLESHD